MDDFVREYHHLTHPQKRIWYIEQIYPDTSLHNIGGPIHIKGSVDFDVLETAIHIFIKRHEGLRLQFMEENGEVKQYVNASQPFRLELVDFSGSQEPRREFNKWVEQESQRVFKLYGSPLFQFTMFKIAADDQGYFVRFHHLIADGWTINIMTEQICESYLKLKQGEAVTVITAPSYLEYFEEEQKYLLSERFEKDRRFWNEKFSFLPECLPANKNSAISGQRKTYQLPVERSIQIKSFCNRHKISLNTFFTAALLIYRFKVTQQTDIVLGIPVLNRSGKRAKEIVGMFTSTMPFRFTITGSEDIDHFLQQVHSELLNCFYHQKFPYNLLVHDLELKKKGYDSLFDICINYYNTRLNNELNGLCIENVEFYNGNQLYSLQLVIKDWSERGNLTLDFDYRLSDFNEPQIERLYHSLNNISDQLLGVSGIQIGQMDILSDQERQHLLFDFNATASTYPQDKTIHQLFEAQVQKTPDKTAICFGTRVMTYLELNEKANRLARLLRNKGVGRESIVGLMTTHSFETIIGIMGIIKAGGAYLPIDPDNPFTRTRYLLDDAKARLLLTNCLPNRAGELNFEGEILDLREAKIDSGDCSNLLLCSQPDNLVYVIYTSGSTGRPKGVMIEHRGLVNYISWANKVYVHGENEVFALYSSLAFDLTVTSIFTPLIGGHQIYICNDDGTDFVVDKILREGKATIIKLTPAHLSLLLDHSPTRYRDSAVRCFIVGGEDFKTSLAAGIQQSFGTQLAIYNEYGPTETVVGCMIHRYNPVKDKGSSVPIGVPADNVWIYVLDTFLKPVPVGVDGEMYISGDGVARGYLNQRELTGERFMDNPFNPGKKMYRTGDLARFLDDCTIEYRGRVDYQVKIHGYRIELGEIEAALVSHPSLKEAVVIDRTDTDHGKYLCAYYVAQADLTAVELRGYLAQLIPEYMIPLAFTRLPKLPLSINGKVNRSLLPELKLNSIEPFGEDPSYRNETETVLAGIITEVLNTRVRVTDNFFQLGGDSIKAIQIAAKLKERAFKIKVKDILIHPVIAEMAAQIEMDDMVVDQEPADGWIDSTPIVQWFFSRGFKNINHWNQSVLLNLVPQVDINKLNLILDALIKHHDSLRINYNVAIGKLFYNPVYLTETNSVAVFDLSEYSSIEQEKRINSIGTELKSSLDLETGILFKAALFDCGPCGKKLLLTAHHLIIDGISWRILLDDLAGLMERAAQNQPFQLPRKTFSYQKWAAELVGYSQSIGTGHYWETIVKEEFQFPTDYDRGEDYLEYCRTITRTLPAVETEVFLTTANLAYHTEPNELLLIALVLTITDWVGEIKVLLELEGHGREDVVGGIDVSRTIGWFTTIYPVRLQVDRQDLPSQIKSLKEQLRGIPNKGFDFGALKYIKGAFSGPEQKLVRFNYLGDFENSFRRGLLEFAHEISGLESSGSNTLTSLLEINVMNVNHRLQFSITYSQNKFLDETVQKFCNTYFDWIRVILRHCQTKKQNEFTPADFDTVDLSQSDLDGLFI